MVFLPETIVFSRAPDQSIPEKIILSPSAARCLSAARRLTPLRLSSPDFLHKFPALVKTTTCEKVGKREKCVESFYVNQKCFSTFHNTCGKPLWKRLWRMWKTMGYQQIFRFFPIHSPPVENFNRPRAFPSQSLPKGRVTSPGQIHPFLAK